VSPSARKPRLPSSRQHQQLQEVAALVKAMATGAAAAVATAMVTARPTASARHWCRFCLRCNRSERGKGARRCAKMPWQRYDMPSPLAGEGEDGWIKQRPCAVYTVLRHQRYPWPNPARGLCPWGGAASSLGSERSSVPKYRARGDRRGSIRRRLFRRPANAESRGRRIR
jgi:hypothetical protein